MMCEKNVLLRSLREPNIEAGPEKNMKRCCGRECVVPETE